jgi:hypothetical protein
MVQVRGTRAKLHHAGEAWCRGRTTWPIDCPDGVTRCITIPNWKWGIWSPEYRPDAFTAGPLARHVAAAWDHAKVFARHFDPTAALADALIFNVELHHRRPNYWPANENTRAMADACPASPRLR